MHRLMATLALGLAVVGAQAQSSSEPALDCKSPDLGQQGMNKCAWEAFKVQDRELNQLYKRLLKHSDAESAKQLQAAQRAWLQFRDLECIFESPDAGGSLGSAEKAECQEALTKERIGDIKRSLR
jgi:uncharacterized protein YecT (DUF1311 family)